MLKLDIQKRLNNSENEQVNLFIIQPLEANQGLTLGNLLRRNLFSNTPGIAISGIKINDNNTEFEDIFGIREDIFEISLNLKEIVFCLPSISCELKLKLYGYINLTGPKILTAGLLKFPKKTTRVLNPTKYICTLVSKKSFYLEVQLFIDRGYNFSNVAKMNSAYKVTNNLFPLNNTYCPIKNVTYFTNLCYNNNGLLKESLNLEIRTNGSVTPTRCLFESLKFLNQNIKLIVNKLTLIEL